MSLRIRHRARQAGRRGGYTLLGGLLALGIAVLPLGALYVALRVQGRPAQAGRAGIEEATLARNLLTRIGNDVSAAVNLADPARFRRTTKGSVNSTAGGTGTTASASSAGMTGTGSASATAGTTGGSGSASGSGGSGSG